MLLSSISTGIKASKKRKVQCSAASDLVDNVLSSYQEAAAVSSRSADVIYDHVLLSDLAAETAMDTSDSVLSSVTNHDADQALTGNSVNGSKYYDLIGENYNYTAVTYQTDTHSISYIR